LPSRGPPYYGFLEMSIKPVVTGATTAIRAGCVWADLVLVYARLPDLKYGRISKMNTDQDKGQCGRNRTRSDRNFFNSGRSNWAKFLSL